MTLPLCLPLVEFALGGGARHFAAKDIDQGVGHDLGAGAQAELGQRDVALQRAGLDRRHGRLFGIA